MPSQILLASNAAADIENLDYPDRAALLSALEELAYHGQANEAQPAKIEGHGYFVMPVGKYNVVFRPLTEKEVSKQAGDAGAKAPTPGILIAAVFSQE
jgi:mRNA-degrading endonuclease RelE of RelBE toxin-antitoxin system